MIAALLSVAAALAVPVVVFAAGDVQNTLPVNDRFWGALLAVQCITALGYFASSLPTWARWLDDQATMEQRLAVVSGALTAVMAGNVAYFGSLYYMHTAEVSAFISSGVAAWGGDKFLTPILQKIVGSSTGERNG